MCLVRRSEPSFPSFRAGSTQLGDSGDCSGEWHSTQRRADRVRQREDLTERCASRVGADSSSVRVRLHAGPAPSCRLNFPAGIVARWCWFRGSALCVQAFGRGWWPPFSAAPQDGCGEGYGGVERRVRRSSRRYRPEASANSRSRASRDRRRRLPQERDVCAGARAEPRWLRPTQARHAAGDGDNELGFWEPARWFTRTTPS